MRDWALRAAGTLAILVAVAHGVIAERFVFVKARIEPPLTRRLLHLIWHASTVDWIAIGALLIAAPWFDSQIARRWVVMVAVFVYAYAALANALATRTLHFGWVAMVCVVALAIVGL